MFDNFGSTKVICYWRIGIDRYVENIVDFVNTVTSDVECGIQETK